MSFQHRFRRRVRLAVALALLVAGPTCSYPTDESDSVEVVITGTEFVLRGEQITLSAKAMQVTGVDTTLLQNVTFAWTSADPNLATVADLGTGSAEVTGVNLGTVDIVARPVAFEHAEARPFTMRVSDPVVLDSVRPDSVRWGQMLTVFGIGVDDQLSDARLGGVSLLRVPGSGQRDTVTGLARVSYWVPFPAITDSLLWVSLGAGLLGRATDTTQVIRRDVYEPNDSVPRSIFLDTLTGPFPSTPDTLLLNPALAFEPLGAVTSRGDWYRFGCDILRCGRDRTIIVKAPLAKVNFQSDSVEYVTATRSYRIGPYAWKIAPGDHACLGLPFRPPQRVQDSVVVALGAGVGTRPFGIGPRLHQVLGYDREGVYELAVVEKYVVTHPSIPRDDHEEDDYCDAAEPSQDPAIALPFRDTLTIDNPNDIDWFRVVGSGQSVRMRTAAVGPPLEPPLVSDTTRNIDLYLMLRPNIGDSQLGIIGASQSAGTVEDLTFTLFNGLVYYIVVVDAGAVPTRYDFCVGAGGACNAFPAASAAAATQARRLPSARP
jgi:hypothetical protein